MNKKWASFFLCILGILISVSIWFLKNHRQRMPIEKIQHVKSEYGSYFFGIDITKFTLSNQPCLSLLTDGREVSAMLDLGFRGQFSFSSQFLESVENKKYLGFKKMYGVRGNEYEEKLYEVPEISIGPISFPFPMLHEQANQFHADSILLKVGDEISISEPGKVGWELFGNTNLFLDLRNSKIAFCDSIETLGKEGYMIDHFIKTPLLLERGLVEFDLQTSKGPLRCMLDTGSTWNVLNSDIEEAVLSDSVIADTVEISSFQVDERNLGTIFFHRFPIKLPIRVEAVLGMEFFEQYIVFLDFSENCAYLLKNN